MTSSQCLKCVDDTMIKSPYNDWACSSMCASRAVNGEYAESQS